MRLHQLSEKVVQCGLLAIVLLLPLVVNPFGNRFYRVPKVIFFRFAVLLLLTAWLVGLINSKVSATRSLRKLLTKPLVLPTLLFTFTHILSTITSVAPHVSFWGSYSRESGTYNVLCYAIFFFLLILNLRTARQRERLITVALLASLPVAGSSRPWATLSSSALT
jgi:hypothetical protein